MKYVLRLASPDEGKGPERHFRIEKPGRVLLGTIEIFSEIIVYCLCITSLFISR